MPDTSDTSAMAWQLHRRTLECGAEVACHWQYSTKDGPLTVAEFDALPPEMKQPFDVPAVKGAA